MCFKFRLSVYKFCQKVEPAAGIINSDLSVEEDWYGGSTGEVCKIFPSYKAIDVAKHIFFNWTKVDEARKWGYRKESNVACPTT